MSLRSKSARFSAVFFLAAWVLLGSSGIVFADEHRFNFNRSKEPDTLNIDAYEIQPTSFNDKKILIGKSLLVQKDDLCARIRNNSGKEIFVPVKTAGEFGAFLRNVTTNVPGVSLETCANARCRNLIANTTLCPAGERTANAVLVQTCGTAKCEYQCASPYHYSSGNCCEPEKNWSSAQGRCVYPVTFFNQTALASAHCTGKTATFFAEFSIQNTSSVNAVFERTSFTPNSGSSPASFTAYPGSNVIDGFGKTTAVGATRCPAQPASGVFAGSATYSIKLNSTVIGSVTYSWTYPTDPAPSPSPSATPAID